ncbi:MAG: MBL fold metallo-hydrolase [Candidatus Dojkabacteria bacterium]
MDTLKAKGLGVDGIDSVFLSHYHPDHILNIRLFPEHTIYDGDTIYKDDHESFLKIKSQGQTSRCYQHLVMLTNTRLWL